VIKSKAVRDLAEVTSRWLGAPKRAYLRVWMEPVRLPIRFGLIRFATADLAARGDVRRG
jgi:hypothetical protein